MEFKFGRFDPKTQKNRVYRPPYVSPALNYDYSDHAMQAELLTGRSEAGPQILRGPVDNREAIQREIAKKRIREEILAEENARKRALEAEVRRELMIEREMMATRNGAEGFPSSIMLVAPPPCRNNRFETVMPHRQPMGPDDWRIAMSYADRREIEGVEMVLPFQSLTRSPKIKEFTTPTEVGKKVIRLGKPSGATVIGTKRKPPSPPPSPTPTGSSQLSAKRPMEEWNCAVCHVTATSEHGLNEHLAGKKHQTQMAAQQAAGARVGLGVAPTKPTAEPVTLLKCKNNAIKNSSNSVSNDSKKFLFWCETCHVGANCEKDMNRHKNGKKHVKELLKLGDQVMKEVR